jgi:hypothetical protein
MTMTEKIYYFLQTVACDAGCSDLLILSGSDMVEAGDCDAQCLVLGNTTK